MGVKGFRQWTQDGASSQKKSAAPSFGSFPQATLQAAKAAARKGGPDTAGRCEGRGLVPFIVRSPRVPQLALSPEPKP